MECCEFGTRDRILNPPFTFKLPFGTNKLEHLSLVSLSSCAIEQYSLLGQFVSYKKWSVVKTVP
jgi:hypothetical protein